MTKLIDYLRLNAHHYPDKVALRIGASEWTYADALERVEQFCNRFRGSVQPGERVALWFNNSINWYVAFIGLNELDAIAAPINTRLTATEVSFILGDLDVSAVITVPEYRGRHYLEEAHQICQDLGTGARSINAAEGLSPRDWVDSGQPAVDGHRAAAFAQGVLCIQYTSGTTSLPKGAVLTTAAYLNTALHVARCQRVTPNTSFVSAAPFFHCSGTMHAITVCLVSGCTLNSLDVWDPELFLRVTALHSCDVSHMIYFRDVLGLNLSHARKCLTTLAVGHELGTYDYLQRVHEELGIPGLSNIYGMTETCGQFTMWYPDDPLEQRLSGNGRVQLGNAVRVADPVTHQELPAGVCGEIQMKGHTLFQGYLNRPDAWADAFTPDGWFRSGDQGWLSETGHLHYLSRMKDVIRVGGENFAPAEVEQVLRDLCAVSQVCVLPVHDDRLDEVPVAVLCGQMALNKDELIRQMRARLASYKVPREFYSIDEFPMTATNRIQKNTLKEWIRQGRLTILA